MSCKGDDVVGRKKCGENWIWILVLELLDR
jgi:hypothetical protein